LCTARSQPGILLQQEEGNKSGKDNNVRNGNIRTIILLGHYIFKHGGEMAKTKSALVCQGIKITSGIRG